MAKKLYRYGEKRDYRKIDIYHKTPTGLIYLGSTTWAPTCKEAVWRYHIKHDVPESELRATVNRERGR